MAEKERNIRMRTIITIAGILIIILSFIYIMKNPKQSLMDALMAKRRQGKREEKTDESNQNK
ncbi:hypothetical protein AAK943_10955 [Emergencia timonensis]|uniref:hypothetical protein n=2 Tax=Emergencia timonensis TaxID=1776384 RepID=UPI001A9A3775|nr:hypothetical protein [Emergencia timonensis]